MKKRNVNKSGTKVRIFFKILLVLAVFIASLVFFSSDIKETLFSEEQKVTAMKEASFPMISMEVSGHEINHLHGYAANLDGQIIRECITPITEDRSFTVKLDEGGSNVRKLKYEVFNIDGRQKETEDYTLIEGESGTKSVKINLKENYETGSEYILKLTLITNTSKRIYYYSRIKFYENGKLDEKLEFIMNFHKTLLNTKGKRAEELMDWLEPNRSSDHSTLAEVSIKSRLNLVSYGGLDTKVVYEQVPTVTEFYENYASVRIDYILSIDTELGTEYYRTEEHYRIGMTGNRIYLYNYERNMEEIFDLSHFSPEKREFKLGICSEDAVSTALSPNGRYMAFVYGGELIFYDIEENTVSKVFSFDRDSRDFDREIYRNYDITVLRILDDGTMDFYVSGYMNAGEYEGRVGIVLYNYDNSQGICEEKLYMPVNSSNQVLNTDISDFAYIGDKQVFYFSIYGVVYCYNIAASKLEVLAEGIEDGELVFCEDQRYIAYIDHSSNGSRGAIKIYHLDSGECYEISSSSDEIRLLGLINENVVCGYSRKIDETRQRDGSIVRPCYRMEISNGQGEVLKAYEEDGIFISGVEIGENIITINRVYRDDVTGRYKETESDTILNKLNVTEDPIPLIKDVTDKMLTEYYIGIPGSKEIENAPEVREVMQKVLNKETIARLPEPEKTDTCYYAYSFGRIIASSEDAAGVIRAANEKVGTVINREGKLIWERGIKMPRTELAGISEINASDVISSTQAAMQILADFRGEEIDVIRFDPKRTSIYEFLSENLKPSIVDMTGATLDEVLYCVYRKHPVIAIKADGEACVIYGYEPTSISIYEPAKGKKSKVQLSDAVKDFEKNGNIFISYVG